MDALENQIHFYKKKKKTSISHNAQSHKEDCKPQDFSACIAGVCAWATASRKRSGRRAGKLWMLLACGHHYSLVISVTLTLYIP